MEETLSPRQARMLFRNGECVGKTTSGLCGGYLQANLAVFDHQLADSFALFCKRNSAPCPLLYRSRIGEVGASQLAEASDVRTDLPLYCVWRSGKLVERSESLTKYLWDKNVSFYLGCSFGFEKALQDAGVPVRNIEQQRNVSMFRTNVPCHAVEPFHNSLVVSMRPIPRSLLKETVEATQGLTRAHGAPVHIGDPEMIGIKNVLDPDFGDALDFHKDDIPVFWACGVTALEAVLASGADLAFTHSPGCMFVCDVPSDYGGQRDPPSPVEIVNVTVPGQAFSASVVSLSVAKKVRQLHNHISDPSGKDELLIAASSLSHSQSVAVAVQSPLSRDELAGLQMLASALSSCDVKTTFGIDVTCSDMQSDVEQVLLGCNHVNGIELVVTTEMTSTLKCDCLVTIKKSSGQLPSAASPSINSVKRKTITIGTAGHWTKDVSGIDIEGEAVLALGALALSLCLLRTCPIHVRFAARGICEEPLKVTDTFPSSLKAPERFDELLALALS